jgi:hypothetical protein
MRRAIQAATACGLRVQACVMNPSEIRLEFSSVAENSKKGDDPKPKEWPR